MITIIFCAVSFAVGYCVSYLAMTYKVKQD